MAELMRSLKEYSQVEVLDMSGNNLGKTSAMIDMAEAMSSWLIGNTYLEVL